jgi:chromosome segregation ATPase
MAKQDVQKYFMAGTDEEVLLGDVIETTLEKEFKNGSKITRNVEFKLTEETLPIALEMGIIEAQDEDEENNDELLDFEEDNCPLKEEIDGLVESQEDLEIRVEHLEDKVKELQDKLANKKETASSKKK